jgi:prepilin-type N-terminal cleavage/methylation domain-containing protein
MERWIILLKSHISFLMSRSSPLATSRCYTLFMKKKAFTLVELMIVIAIIGVLSTISVALYSNSVKKGRDAKRRTDLVIIKSALENYFQDTGSYPSTGGTWRGTCATYGSYATTGTNAYIPNLTPKYLAVLPSDPHPAAHPELNAGCNLSQSCYLYNSDGNGFKLLAHCDLEYAIPNASDPMYDIPRSTWAIMQCSGDQASCAL